MSVETERKFLLSNDSWKDGSTGKLYKQGYISTNPDSTVRIRIIDDVGFLTIKGLTTGISRPEFEYEIPLDDATVMLQTMCRHSIIEKIRYRIYYQDFLWEIDEFKGDNQGLILAEIELQSEDQVFPKPEWLGNEVSDDNRYYNSQLSINPYKNWGQQSS